MIIARFEPDRDHRGITRRIALPDEPTAFGLDGDRLAIGFVGRLIVVDLSTGERALDCETEGAPGWIGGAQVRAIALSGDHVVAGVGDRIEVWDARTGDRLAVHPPHGDLVFSLAVDRARSRVASTDITSPGVRVADLLTGEPQWGPGRVGGGDANEENSEGEREDDEDSETQELRPSVQQVADAFDTVESLMYEHAELGFSDTEPGEVFHALVAAAWRGEPAEPPELEGWDAFSDMDGAASAAAEINEAVIELVDAIRAVPDDERRALYLCLKSKIWRADLDASPDDVSCREVGWLPDGRLVVQHPAEIGVWDLDARSRVETYPGERAALEAGELLVRADEGRAVCRAGTGEVVLETLGVVMRGDGEWFGIDAVGIDRVSGRIRAGTVRLGKPVAVRGGLWACAGAELVFAPFGGLAVEHPRDGLPIHALALDPTGPSVVFARHPVGGAAPSVLERWDPEHPEIAVLGPIDPWCDQVGAARGVAWASSYTGVARFPPLASDPASDLVPIRSTTFARAPDGALVDLVTGARVPIDPDRHIDQIDPTGSYALSAGERTYAVISLATGEVREGKVGRGGDAVAVRTDGSVVLQYTRAVAIDRQPIRKLPLPGTDRPSPHAMPDGRVALLYAAGRVAVWDGESPPRVVREGAGDVGGEYVQVVGTIGGDLVLLVSESDDGPTLILDPGGESGLVDGLGGEVALERWSIDPAERRERIVVARTSDAPRVTCAGPYVAVGTASGQIVLLRFGSSGAPSIRGSTM